MAATTLFSWGKRSPPADRVLISNSKPSTLWEKLSHGEVTTLLPPPPPFFEISSKQFIAFLLWEQIENYVGPCMYPFGYPTGRVLARFPACTAVGDKQLSSRFSPPSTASFANAVADNRYNHTKEHERRTEFALCWNITKAVQKKKTNLQCHGPHLVDRKGARRMRAEPYGTDGSDRVS